MLGLRLLRIGSSRVRLVVLLLVSRSSWSRGRGSRSHRAAAGGSSCGSSTTALTRHDNACVLRVLREDVERETIKSTRKQGRSGSLAEEATEEEEARTAGDNEV